MSDKEHDSRDEEEMAELIRMAGRRAPIPDDMKARVRAAAHEEWRSGVSGRKRKRVAAVFAAAAVIATIFVLVRTREVTTPTVPVPVIASDNAATSLDWNGATLRLDADTRVRFVSESQVELLVGAIYFADEGTAPSRVIETRLGTVRDIGTQFEVRLSDDALRIRVREGRVELSRENQRTTIEPGFEVEVTAKGIERRAIETHGGEWEWIERAAPPLVVEGKTIGEVMATIAREKGLQLDMPSDLATIRLRGKTPLSIPDALTAAPAAAGVDAKIEGNRLVVRRTQ